MRYWTTKNGAKIPIKDMTTDHIKNCIKALKEKRIVAGRRVNIDYTCDGDGDGVIYDFIDDSNDYIKEFEKELERRETRKDEPR